MFSDPENPTPYISANTIIHNRSSNFKSSSIPFSQFSWGRSQSPGKHLCWGQILPSIHLCRGQILPCSTSLWFSCVLGWHRGHEGCSQSFLSTIQTIEPESASNADDQEHTKPNSQSNSSRFAYRRLVRWYCGGSRGRRTRAVTRCLGAE